MVTAAESRLTRKVEGAHVESSTERKRILIADDHEVLRRGLRTMLQFETQWEICGEAVDGQEAVDKASELTPDLVIMDINMPVLNGLAAEILRQRPETKILVLTVHDSDQTIHEIIASGAHGYLSKAKGGQDWFRLSKNCWPEISRIPQPSRARPNDFFAVSKMRDQHGHAIVPIRHKNSLRTAGFEAAILGVAPSA